MEINAAANAKAKGKRPWFFANQEAERVMNITMALAQELAVTRERLDTLERLLEDKALLSRAEFDSYLPNKAVTDERSVNQQSYLARILRVISQEIAAIHETDAVSIDELARQTPTDTER
jgi:RNA polymerase-interacting CarD/CdnL/TRCF family regulator